MLASKTGTELPTQFRLTTLIPSDAQDPVPLVTLSRSTSGQLRLVSWRLKKALVYVPIGSPPIATAPKPA